jgi:predicted nucleic acid-binding protein
VILLDTCVVSELAKPRPAAPVLRWLEATPEVHLHVSVLTLGEIENGCARLAAGARRRRLEEWLATLSSTFSDRVVGIDAETARLWGRVSAEATQKGRGVGVVDGLIAATALRHGLSVATRNVDDFAPTGVPLVNPFDDD